MARTKFPVEVLTPEGNIYEGDVEMLSTRTREGSIGILAKHAPVMAILEPAELRLYESEDNIVRFAQAEGYLQVRDSSALLIVEEAHRPEDMDRAAIEAKLKEEQEQAERAEDGSEEEKRSLTNAKRYEVFLAVLDGPKSE